MRTGTSGLAVVDGEAELGVAVLAGGGLAVAGDGLAAGTGDGVTDEQPATTTTITRATARARAESGPGERITKAGTSS